MLVNDATFDYDYATLELTTTIKLEFERVKLLVKFNMVTFILNIFVFSLSFIFSGSPEVGESVSEEGMAGERCRKSSRSQVGSVYCAFCDCLLLSVIT